MTDQNIHNWDEITSLYESLLSHDWKHIKEFMQMLPEIRKAAEKLDLTPRTSHERLILSKYPKYPAFFLKAHLIIHPLPKERIRIEVWDDNHEKISDTVHFRNESLPLILEAIKNSPS